MVKCLSVSGVILALVALLLLRLRTPSQKASSTDGNIDIGGNSFAPITFSPNSLEFGNQENSEFLPVDSNNGNYALDRLLIEFGLSGDVKFLERAQALFPDDLDVVVLSALHAESEDSVWLKKLEGMQPDNSLPYLIRASFFAENSNMVRFKEQMQAALEKSKFDTRYRERLALIQDEMLETGRFPNGVFSDGSLGNLNGMFLKRHSHILDALLDNKALSENADGAISIGLAWANRLQSMPEHNLTYQFFGGYLESEILSGYNADELYPYGADGMTVGDRQEELKGIGDSLHSKISKYNALILNDSRNESDRILKRQFFSRLRADGEMAAVNWLMAN